MDSEHEPITGSFYAKAMESVNSQSPSWKSENLPQDFGKTLEDLTSHDAFMKIFRDKVRHVRDEFRVVLLTNIHISKAKAKQKEPVLPIPKLFTLQGILSRWFNANYKTNEEVDNDMDPKAKARFAYLRLEAAAYNLRSEQEKLENPATSHWQLVDEQLAFLRTKSKQYRKVFDVLVLDKDKGFFNGRNDSAKIKKRADFKPPTNEEVTSAVPFMA